MAISKLELKFVFLLLCFTNFSAYADVGRATISWYSPNISKTVFQNGTVKKTYTKNDQIVTLNLKKPSPSPIATDLNGNPPFSLAVPDYSSIAYDAVGNKYYIALESKINNGIESCYFKLMKLDSNSKNSISLGVIFVDPDVGSVNGFNFAGRISLAYDSTRNILSWFSPGLSKINVATNGTSSTVFVKHAQIFELDLTHPKDPGTLTPIITINDANLLDSAPSSIVYDYIGNLFFTVSQLSATENNINLKKYSYADKKISDLGTIFNKERYSEQTTETTTVKTTITRTDAYNDDVSLAYNQTNNTIAWYSPAITRNISTSIMKIDNGIVDIGSEVVTFKSEKIKHNQIFELNLSNPVDPKSLTQIIDLGSNSEYSSIVYDAAGNLYYINSAANNFNLNKIDTKSINNGALKIPESLGIIFTLPNSTNSIFYSNYGRITLAYDPGQRIFLDFDTPLPVQVCSALDAFSNKVIFPVFDCSISGGCPTIPANTVTYTDGTFPRFISECRAGPDPILPISNKQDDRDGVRNKVAERYAQSGVALPVISSDQFKVVDKSPFSPLPITDAVRVRTSSRVNGLYGKAYQGVDLCNKHRDDNVGVFGLAKGQNGVLNTSDNIAYTISHEVGHTLGLVHVFYDAQTTTNTEGRNIMDYVATSPLNTKKFEDRKLAETEIPLPPSIKCPYPICGSTSYLINNNYVDYGSQNQFFHLLAYSLDEDPLKLQQNVLQKPIGSFDACSNLISSQKSIIIASINNPSNLPISALTIVENAGSSASSVDGDGNEVIATLKTVATNQLLHIDTNRPIKILASSVGGGLYDIAFGLGDPSNPQYVLDSTAGDISGTIFQFAGDNMPPKAIGSFTATIALVTQPDIKVELATSTIQARPNEALTYRVIASNIGSTVARGSRITFTVPTNFVVSSFEPSVTCTGTNEISCDMGDIDPYGNFRLDIVGQTSQLGTLQAQARVSTFDQELTTSNNTVTLNTTVANALTGDINGDGVVDINDINILNNHLNQPAADLNDPLDINKDGVVNVLDVRKLVLMCTNPRCN